MTLSPNGPVTQVGSQFSPDGRVVAYVSDQSGRDEVYVGWFGTSGDAVPFPTDGGNAPRGSPNGKGVFYRRGDAFFAASMTDTKGALSWRQDLVPPCIIPSINTR